MDTAVCFLCKISVEIFILRRPLKNQESCVMSKPQEIRDRSLLAIREDCAIGMPSARTNENEDIRQTNGFVPQHTHGAKTSVKK
jgi:hypothetical protein